jgi:hypothetical protein
MLENLYTEGSSAASKICRPIAFQASSLRTEYLAPIVLPWDVDGKREDDDDEMAEVN